MVIFTYFGGFMGKTVIKDTFREIKGSFGRFFAIFAIVAIGVSSFLQA